MKPATLLLTRTEEKNRALASALGHRLLFPESSIVSLPLHQPCAVPLSERMKQRILKLDLYDHIIFISQNAVRFGLPVLESFWPQWPLAPCWYGVGPATAEALGTWDIDAQVPRIASSEGLLALPALSRIDGQKVLIVRATSGRETLKTELDQRGATVEYLEVYERQVIDYDDQVFRRLPVPVYAPVFSGEDLQRLADLLGNHTTNFHILVTSPRLRTMAFQLGFDKVELSDGQQQEAVLAALGHMGSSDRMSPSFSTRTDH